MIAEIMFQQAIIGSVALLILVGLVVYLVKGFL